MLSVLLALSAAFANPCDIPFTADDVAALAAAANVALDRDDLAAHDQAHDTWRKRAPCITEPINARDWASFLVTVAIVEHAIGSDWQVPLRTALTANPELDLTRAPPEFQSALRPLEEPNRLRRVPDSGRFFLDGVPITEVFPGPLPGPHIAQAETGNGWITRYFEDAPFPNDWLSTEESEVRRQAFALTPTLWTGIGLTAAGAITGISTWAVAQGKGPRTPRKTVNGLTAANVGGWTVAAIGTGLVSWQIVEGTRISAGPRSITVQGAF